MNLEKVSQSRDKVLVSNDGVIKPRCMALFESACKSKTTFKVYHYNLKRFMVYCHVSRFEDLLKIEPRTLNEKIEDWLLHLRDRVNPNSVPTMYYGVELFFAMNNVLINTVKLRRMFPAKIKKSGANPWKTEDIRKMLSHARYTRDKAIVLFLASTGSRIGSIEGLKVKSLVDMSLNCKAVLIYGDDKEEYWAFLTPEATKCLQDYFAERQQDGEVINSESPVFRTIYNRNRVTSRNYARMSPKMIVMSSARSSIYRMIEQARIVREKQGFAYDIQMDHGFRKRFNTILKINSEVNSNIAEKLMGHKRGLDGVYFTPTKEQCFEEFKKAIPELTIDESLRLKSELDTVVKKLDVSESEKDSRILQLEEQARKTEIILKELMKRL